MKFLAGVTAIASTLAGIGIATATVTFDPTTGKGFVGKGDLQTAFGWNNNQLQKKVCQPQQSGLRLSRNDDVHRYM